MSFIEDRAPYSVSTILKWGDSICMDMPPCKEEALGWYFNMKSLKLAGLEHCYPDSYTDEQKQHFEKVLKEHPEFIISLCMGIYTKDAKASKEINPFIWEAFYETIIDAYELVLNCLPLFLSKAEAKKLRSCVSIVPYSNMNMSMFKYPLVSHIGRARSMTTAIATINPSTLNEVSEEYTAVGIRYDASTMFQYKMFEHAGAVINTEPVTNIPENALAVRIPCVSIKFPDDLNLFSYHLLTGLVRNLFIFVFLLKGLWFKRSSEFPFAGREWIRAERTPSLSGIKNHRKLLLGILNEFSPLQISTMYDLEMNGLHVQEYNEMLATGRIYDNVFSFKDSTPFTQDTWGNFASLRKALQRSKYGKN